MHHALGIAEIISLILEHIQVLNKTIPQSLKPLITVNKFISDIALAELWRSISFNQILLTFPLDLLGCDVPGYSEEKANQRVMRYYRMKRPITTSDWTRFDYYAAFVRELRYTAESGGYFLYQIDHKLLPRMMRSRSESSWFPNLRAVSYHLMTHDLVIHLHNASLTSLSLSVMDPYTIQKPLLKQQRKVEKHGNIMNDYLKSIMIGSCYCLKELQLGQILMDQNRDLLRQLLERISLQKLTLTFRDDSSEDMNIIEAIQRQTSLEELHIDVKGSFSAPATHQAEAKPVLSRLKNLKCSIDSISAGMVLINQLSKSPITHLQLKLKTRSIDDPTPSFDELVKAIRQCNFPVQDITVYIPGYELELGASTTEQIVVLQESIFELISFKSLKRFLISSNDDCVNQLLDTNLVSRLAEHITSISQITLSYFDNYFHLDEDLEELTWSSLDRLLPFLSSQSQLNKLLLNNVAIRPDFGTHLDPLPQITELFLGDTRDPGEVDLAVMIENIRNVFPRLSSLCLCGALEAENCAEIRTALNLSHLRDSDPANSMIEFRFVDN